MINSVLKKSNLFTYTKLFIPEDSPTLISEHLKTWGDFYLLKSVAGEIIGALKIIE